ncbi:hypothetical protein LTR56_021401 [Elasticomyces elasticus]|nr:hypothetical protein LTR22_026456 [Elasticomyces elasticus]KAK3623748.1 hypothetical protein LTR56_021401 [Elasticomyces elasticus]KAK4907165.1 hypothetical protein LTR49_023812 [Elasticomyces elasticus]KAK5754307.1 hypothetical protein LTS12_015598 [Elasticomyces elasticus]
MTFGSFTRFQTDDYLMLVGLCFYTTLVVAINIVRNTNSNLIPPGYDTSHLSQQDIRERTYGSKLILVVEQCQICTIWLAKACLLTMYFRLTNARRENIAIKVLCGLVAFGFVFMEIFYFGVWCRPFSNYWAVPTPNIQCDAATNHLITNAVINLSSDIAMIVIGLPMFIRMSLPLRKKIPLIGIFSLGIFVILAAILNKVYSAPAALAFANSRSLPLCRFSLTSAKFSQPYGSLWTYWYVRESSTALLVANLPFCWVLWRKLATGKGSIAGLSRKASATPEDALSRGEKEARRQDVLRRRSSPWQIYGIDHNPDEHEMGRAGDGRAAGGMTLDEVLRESNTDLTAGEEISPYTHPGLFYSRQARHANDSTDQLERAVVSESTEKDTVRRDSSSGLLNDTPVSSVFPHSFNSKKSAGSFL